MSFSFRLATEAPDPRTPDHESAPSAPRYSDLLDVGRKALSSIERAQIRFVRRTFEHGRLSDALVLHQRLFGANWVHYAVRNLLELHGAERFPKLAKNDSFILASNHRSFFDMYALTSQLIKRMGVSQRLLFPVRSKFFYDLSLIHI